MFLDPITNEVVDYVGGRSDLEAKVIRAIGEPEDRFAEDHLRMLRAVRLAARLGYAIESATFAAIQRHAAKILEISRERIGEEVMRILREGAARRGFELLDATGLLEQILPEISAMKGVEQSPDFHPEGDVFRHTMLLLEQLDRPTESLALGALLHDVAKPLCARRDGDRITFYGHPEQGEEMATEICQRLRRSREVWERTAYLVRNHLRLVNAPQMRRSTLRRFLAEDGIDELLELARMDAMASHQNLTHYQFCRDRLAELKTEGVRPEPLVRGRDLLDLGYPEGPLYGEILREAETRQLEGDLTTREAALEWVRNAYPIGK
jgi:poly(A) polymerase